ncbi:hypothetical protein OVA29_12195 [Exiguobacterium sp. SL14]|nr:hypothetical protein [Exiguobacterium sp. SL14]MCY1691354.1 hypothetical protein [Exiguobacterium sp. SL14]
MIAFFIYFEPFRIEPYDPDVEVNGKQVPTVQGSYCWSSLFSAQCADMIYVDALHMTEKSKPVIVSPNDKIHLSFDRKPDTLQVVRWDSKTKSEQVSLTNDVFTAPSAQGTYTYEIIARWNERGDGLSAFLILVQ